MDPRAKEALRGAGTAVGGAALKALFGWFVDWRVRKRPNGWLARRRREAEAATDRLVDQSMDRIERERRER